MKSESCISLSTKQHTTAGFLYPSTFLLLISLVSFLSLGSSKSYTVSPTATATPTITPTPTPPLPSRSQWVTSTKQAYQWGLFWWQNGQVACYLTLENEEYPTLEQVKSACGQTIHDAWRDTPPCSTPDKPGKCEGLVLNFINHSESQVTELVDLLPPEVYVNTVNCPPWQTCNERPQLSFQGVEAVEGYYINYIHIQVGDKGHDCHGDLCSVKLPVTDKKGVVVSYWAESSFGDQTKTHTFRMRNLELRDNDGYRFEVLGEPWEQLTPPCASIWQVFPDLEDEGFPWSERLDGYKQLHTNHQYALLAGNLIWTGEVESENCPEGGMLESGAANTCGIQAAIAQVYQRQNAYDDLILYASQEKNVPPRVLKGMIGQESQFWPAACERDREEWGLGMLTEDGADLLLTWNVDYYLDVCIPYLGETRCASGYTNLSEYNQEYLRGLAMQTIGTDAEIHLLADTLIAACGQAGQLVRNVTGLDLPYATSYDDLWSITLATYNVGAGCMAAAMEKDFALHRKVQWTSTVNYLPEGCSLADDYVDNVLYYGAMKKLARGEGG